MPQPHFNDKEYRWYAVNTYNTYEDKAADLILQRRQTMDLDKEISDVLVPKEKQIELKNGQRVVVERRIFQGYILVQMKLTDQSWRLVRDTPHVSGFVGDGQAPTPIEPEEVDKIRKRMGVNEPHHKIDYKVGDVVCIIEGAFKDQEGPVAEIDTQKGKLKVLINIFGRETPTELDVLQVRSL